jgi:26S proteasome regulatory subunit N6
LKEISILKAAQIIKVSGDFSALASFVRSLNSLWTVFPRAKTAKLVKSLLDLFEEIGGEEPLLIEIELCRELLQWSENEKRTFLKQAIEIRLIALFHRTGQYSEALTLVSQLLLQLKRLDDKNALIEVHLLESKIYFALKNVAKARAALTSARTFANSMYTAPIIQAALDMQAGLLHAEELDFKTAFSYFIEALDNYVNSEHDSRGVQAFKYLLLCKIMMGQSEDVEVICAGKLGQHYPSCRDFEAMKAVATSCIEKSLKSFENVLQAFPKGKKNKFFLNFLYIFL